MSDAAVQLSPGDWPAPLAPASSEAAGKNALVHIPGSKSLTNRYLLLAALADSPSYLRAPLRSRDSALMIEALRQLGAGIELVPTDSPFGPDVKVTPLNFAQPGSAQAVSIECGLAGTVMRFVPALAALLPGEFAFDGDPHARQRPMGPVLEGLRQLGVQVDCEQGENALPFVLRSPGLASVEGVSEAPVVRIDASTSSQFVSALLLMAPRLPQGMVLVHEGSSVPSIPHIQMTVEALRQMGIEVQEHYPNQGNEAEGGEYRWTVHPGSFPGFEMTIEPDLSNAGPFLAAAVVTGESVTIPHWPEPAADSSAGTTQVGDMWRELLPALGAQVRYAEGRLTVTGPAQLPEGDFSFDLSAGGELAPTMAAACAFVKGRVELTGIAHLRGHETDRLAALAAEINRLGGTAHDTADSLVIEAPIPATAEAAQVLAHTYDDHRMATFAAIIGLRRPNVVVQNVATVAKTMPEFTAMWEDMLAQWQAGASTSDVTANQEVF
ncbi:3-phosphoshikimate 1-carboxyvinyltransferase [Rothia sp. (in: high G+C Gram-positive bacteria)]|uniref:3-phosphoshikimate 1-carboxyvinyltransferase n=1 Tax=Rothia sp. (in: high G+C Gram-positive bacteria) TaxID=1885016 RepID=UPI001CB3F163|nr:3-phosphoshikimate 1-carboxyvinyltransferase [Rothia sp. (in: high G+C Gram-positive bacteria)]MBF1669053.1 3-phosphoshikimate 1-carboxyvinyltransferase [Rothia sp. (in: high G+C Gram-positive bacteria)]